MSDTTENSGSRGRTVLIVLFLISLVGNGYLMYQWYQSNYKDGKSLREINAELNEALSMSNISLDSLQNEYNSLEQLYQAILLESENHQIQNDSLVKVIENQKVRIRSLFNSSNRIALAQAKKELETMRETLKAAEDKVVEVLREREYMEESINELQSENESLAAQKSQTEKAVKDLENKIKDAKFQIDDLRVKPLREKRGRMEETQKASKVKEIEISFVVVESDLVEEGEKEIIIRILGTSGEVLGADNESLRDSDELYSMSKSFNYQGDSEKMTFNYEQDASYKKGGYMVEIWHDNERLVRTQFNLE